MQKIKIQKNKGFTLIETLVAISLFSFSAIALLVTLSGGIRDMDYVKNKFIAENLAVEGVEYVRNIRDTYALYSGTNPAGWQAFIAKFSQCVKNAGDFCYFDNTGIDFSDQTQPIVDINVTQCSPVCPPLRVNLNTGKYDYDSNNSTSFFTRKIEIEYPTNLNNGAEVKVYSTVTWQDGARRYETVFTENLFNWITP